MSCFSNFCGHHTDEFADVDIGGIAGGNVDADVNQDAVAAVRCLSSGSPHCTSYSMPNATLLHLYCVLLNS